jgi:hypothetical protein
MAYIAQEVRDRVAAQAGYRCEYCLTSQEISGAKLHVDHIVPLAEGGNTEDDNLCLASAWCNSYKWAKTRGSDPVSGRTVELYNPRTQTWSQHFRWSDDSLTIVGLTAIGRATIDVLRMNNEYIIPARRHWVEAGWHPPESGQR